MTLMLPADAERFLQDAHDYDRLRGPAVYCLVLERPEDLAAVWDDHFETRPDYFPRLEAAGSVLYVGSATDALGRLTEHKDGETRLTVLTEICTIDRLRNLWWCERDRRRVVESQMASLLEQELGDVYVHQR